MGCECGYIRSITDELHFSDIEEDQMEGESDVTPSIIDELHSSDVEEDQIKGESCVTRSIID